MCPCVCMCVCAHLLSFHKVCYYDDGGDPELPDHPPEVFNVVRKRSLAGNVCAGFSVALGGGGRGVGEGGGGRGVGEGGGEGGGEGEGRGGGEVAACVWVVHRGCSH